MKKKPYTDVVLIGYEDQENLGLRSIKAYLDSKNQVVAILPFKPGKESQLLKSIKQHDPKIIGVSIIFQYSLDDFKRLISYLRQNGISSHFTAGGHFPSLEPQVVFNEIPELNSIVRFEGEITLSELISRVDHDEALKDIESLAYRNGTEVIINPVRRLIDDLDKLPFLFRDRFFEVAEGIKTSFMLASRGCLYNCSFCSIRQFYGSAPGQLRRVRSAENVVDEMYQLYTKYNVRFFSFQDDDFANRSKTQQLWLKAFLDELAGRGLKDKIRWKISCRVDDLNPDSLELMIEHGLIAVYLGVESGNDEGLATLNKKITVEQNLYAINLLKKYNVAMSIGFMLFDPSSSIESLRKNIEFLRIVGNDGYFPINFCKMLPYAGTPIEQQLKTEGRLLGTSIQPDYEFQDPLVNWYYFIVNRIFSRRNFKHDGLVNLLQSVEFENRLKMAFNPGIGQMILLSKIHDVIGRANISAIHTLERLLDLITSTDIDYLLDEKNILLDLIEQEWQNELKLERELEEIRANEFSQGGIFTAQNLKV
jgi:anaerobic magnesium-protoporphyrin IX monomethyl ester cyclase